jgi:hypothetical protein
MAIELKGTIELKDLTAVEFRCKRCGHASIRRLDDQLRVPALCGNCDAHWQADSEAQALLQFLRNLASYAAKDRAYSLRLHVEEGLEGFMAARPKP